MTVSLRTLAAIYYFAHRLCHMDGDLQGEETDVVVDFLESFREMTDENLEKIFALADDLDDETALALIDKLDDDGKKQVGEFFLKLISADGLISEEEEDLFNQIKERCGLQASVFDSDAFWQRLWNAEPKDSGTEEEEVVKVVEDDEKVDDVKVVEWVEVEEEESEEDAGEEAGDAIIPAFLVVNYNGVGTMQQSEHEDWSTLGDELASWIRARRVEVVRFTPPLNAISEKLNLLGRHLVFMIARGQIDMTVGDNMPATILYGAGEPLYGDIAFALETDGDYEIEGFRTFSLFQEAMQAINEAVDGLIELPDVTFGGQEEETEEEVWPDEADGVPYNMDWETIHDMFDEEDQAVGLAALHGDAAALAKYARMYRENHSYYESLLEIQETDWEAYAEEYNLGRTLYLEEKYEEAIPHFLKAAKRGNEYAMFALGLCWDELNDYSGDRSEDECLLGEFEWYLKAAVNQHPEAHYKIGAAYYKGWVPDEEGTFESDEKDYESAAFWFHQGVVLEDSDCANHLASMYQDGEGVEKDEVKAVELYRKALEFNPDNFIAQFNLGLCYEKGRGIPASDDEAAKWFWKAKDKFNEAKSRYAMIRYDQNPGDSTAIALLKEAAAHYSYSARDALDQLGIKY